MAYDPQSLETKYQKIWRDHKIYEPDLLRATRPYYNLMMFPYPSAEGLHVGNMYAFTGADVHGRFRRMQGYDVFEPIGLDGFGIHSENYAIKIGRHPEEQAKISQENFYRQLTQIGNGFSWEERLETYDPAFYRWTQWLFIQMFKHGLAYKGTARVNWCPSCKTVLADEQVEDGKCERCKTEVERREMNSWYFKITDYAERLLHNIDHYEWTDIHGEKHTGLRWPGKVTIAQRNWIGQKEGLAIDFAIVSDTVDKNQISVWTKFWETIFGATYLVVAPEYPGLDQLVTPDQAEVVKAYVQQSLNKSEQERQIGRDKTGVFTGSYVVNPATGEQIPVWVADYVLMDVGTGAVMGVPAHDQRDFDFAKRFNLPIRQVVAYADTEINSRVAAGLQSHEAEGVLINSGEFDGRDAWGVGKSDIKAWLVSQGNARVQVNYHLRDWLISRQRYWGPPIPLVYCEHCAGEGRGERADLPGWYTVSEDTLPVELPHIEDFKPKGDGTSPLDNASDDWKFTSCPECSGQAKRETDVSDTFLDSAWYFLRYPAVGQPGADTHPFGHISDEQRYDWFPVDAYIGGAEHAVLHLLYARFVTMALHDWGYVPSDEPFPFLFGHGLIIKDGAKMSKSKGNIVNPDEYIAKYGADALRGYLMFLGPYEQGGDFRDTGMHGMYKWLARVWDTVKEAASSWESVESAVETSPVLKQKLHQTIVANTADMGEFKFNTCLARLMEVVNVWREGQSMARISPEDVLIFLQLLAPFAPYVTEELYQEVGLSRLIGGRGEAENGFFSIHSSSWPVADPEQLVQAAVTIAVQVNGKLRATLEIASDQVNDESAVVALASELAEVQRHCQSREIKKSIYVPGRIVNFVV
jgi:leucyl-tRNA synthetase